MKIFIDDSGGFEWITPGVSLFCAVTVSDKTLDGITSNFIAWKERQSCRTAEGEVKGKDLSQLQQASFANAVILIGKGLGLTLAGTKTSLFKKEIAEKVIQNTTDTVRAAAKWGEENEKPDWANFYKRMARWFGERSPENLMWLYSLGDAIHLSIQHSIVMFGDEADDCEFEDIEICIDKSFIGRPTHVEFWHEWLRNFLYNKSKREPTIVIREWSDRNHPFHRKYKSAGGICDWSDLFRNHVKFADSKDVLGVQIADICANICYRYFSGKPKYRPYRLLRSRIMGKHDSEIHYAVLDETSLLRDAPENHVSPYSEEELAAMDLIGSAGQFPTDTRNDESETVLNVKKPQ
jgi:hypothetical protein